MLAASFEVASVLRSNGLFTYEIYWLQEYLGGDHIVHLLMGAAFMLAGYLFTSPRSPRGAAGISILVLILLAVEELSQVALQSREFNWMDLLMGVSGATLISAIFALYLSVVVPVLERRHTPCETQK